MPVETEHDFLFVRQLINGAPYNLQPLHVQESAFRRNIILTPIEEFSLHRPGIGRVAPIAALVIQNDISGSYQQQCPRIANLHSLAKLGKPRKGGLGDVFRLGRARAECPAKLLAKVLPVGPVQFLNSNCM